jgi:hypothetical protein
MTQLTKDALTEDRTDPSVEQTGEPAVHPAPRRAGAGLVMPTWAVLASLAVALVAALAFFITGSPDRAVRAEAPGGTAGSPQINAAPSSVGSQPGSDPVGPPEGGPAKGSTKGSGEAAGKPDQSADDRRGSEPAAPVRTAAVDVYNNSDVSGLAEQTGTTVRGLGWTVVTEDDWYGAIPESTVYYPAALAEQAKQLAKDLGIARVRPAVSPMSFERLTLILTSTP